MKNGETEEEERRGSEKKEDCWTLSGVCVTG